MQEEPKRYTFIFAPPEDDAECWNLDIRTFAEKLKETFSDSCGTRELGDLGFRPAPTLSFEVELSSGEWLDGTVSSPLPATGSVVLSLATPQEGAEFGKWLRDVLVPDGAPVRFTSELALENGVEDARTIPQVGDASGIVGVVEEHVVAVEEALR
jgi:hypothetical protein